MSSKLRQMKRTAQNDAPKFEPIGTGHAALTPEVVAQLLPEGIPVPPHLLMRVGEMLASHQMRNIAAALAKEIQANIDSAVIAAQALPEKQAIIRAALEAHAKRTAALEELKRSA